MSDVLLSARDLRVAFGGVVAANGATLDVMNGEFLAIIGPNGAGKTTFCNIATGYLVPASGELIFAGSGIGGKSPRALVKLGIARSFQLPQLFTKQTVIENMLISACARRGLRWQWTTLADDPARAEMMGLLEALELGEFANALVSTLAEGHRKILDVALALALKPKLIFMDEPTSGIASGDKDSVMRTLVSALKELSVTAVFVEHDIDVVARYADRVAVWSAGCVAAIGGANEVLSDFSIMREVMGA